MSEGFGEGDRSIDLGSWDVHAVPAEEDFGLHPHGGCSAQRSYGHVCHGGSVFSVWDFLRSAVERLIHHAYSGECFEACNLAPTKRNASWLVWSVKL